jgi:hypothetical protein
MRRRANGVVLARRPLPWLSVSVRIRRFAKARRAFDLERLPLCRLNLRLALSCRACWRNRRSVHRYLTGFPCTATVVSIRPTDGPLRAGHVPWPCSSFATQSWKRAENKSRGGPLRQSRNSAQWSESLLNLLLTWMLQRKTTAQTSFGHLRSGRRKRDENVQIQMRCKASSAYSLLPESRVASMIP